MKRFECCSWHGSELQGGSKFGWGSRGKKRVLRKNWAHRNPTAAASAWLLTYDGETLYLWANRATSGTRMTNNNETVSGKFAGQNNWVSIQASEKPSVFLPFFSPYWVFILLILERTGRRGKGSTGWKQWKFKKCSNWLIANSASEDCWHLLPES